MSQTKSFWPLFLPPALYIFFHVVDGGDGDGRGNVYILHWHRNNFEVCRPDQAHSHPLPQSARILDPICGICFHHFTFPSAIRPARPFIYVRASWLQVSYSERKIQFVPCYECVLGSRNSCELNVRLANNTFGQPDMEFQKVLRVSKCRMWYPFRDGQCKIGCFWHRKVLDTRCNGIRKI